MEKSLHNMSNLFAQLGEADDEMAIAKFIEAHRGLPNEVKLHEASFWTASQASFLRESVGHDADWAGVIETLNAALHQPG